ncbi:hypothetical protein KBZ18_11890 [Synechococcus sp. Cruz-9H2]|uniref:hypothetical protein n=1 Tax=unclassified Synechococcus TaxID=2626047 RepID=UPI0020CD93E7|nr:MULTISPECIES: hypothetical protein [unclassified Synechococcus]MCP9820185.1 hypothetical protein [Synechococcus sp. Cruz-9H2]MCP9844575.1 hypothetical protein [Synechococcus sp. Edmonson 11F2]MCP9856615.1 hypothetical protein [Synechococcus sp. Cruz-9C9]MCP9863900.1 hypothetical protein [Synechococcus sp. Cruz-7E5]MCP9871178.1 hypothetical protein [Synechococcus sp. Cruz-7B9]
MSAPANLNRITISVVSVDRLIDAGGTPLIQPHIHPDVARWIYEEAKENPHIYGYEIEILVPVSDSARGAEVESTVQSYFLSEAEWADKEFRAILRNGFASLMRAFLVVVALTLLSEFLHGIWKNRFYLVLSESLVIIGWVTLWGPLDLLLFERNRIRRRQMVARALSVSRVTLTSRQ